MIDFMHLVPGNQRRNSHLAKKLGLHPRRLLSSHRSLPQEAATGHRQVDVGNISRPVFANIQKIHERKIEGVMGD